MKTLRSLRPPPSVLRSDRQRRGSPPLSLREACARAGLDQNGDRCPECPVRDLCGSELRWVMQNPGDRGGYRC